MDLLVSVIITTFNRADFIEQSIEAIQNQTYKNLEIIVVDDGSNNVIAKKVESICSKYNKCRYFWKKNSGQPDSRNYGLKLAKGTYIGFCDDDDYWVLNKLEKQVKILNENPSFGIVTGCIEYINSKGISLNVIKCHNGNNHGYVFEDFVIKNRTDSVTPLLRKEVFDKAGFFNPKFSISEDWDFWRRASYYYKFYALNEVLAFVRKHESNMTNKTFKAHDGLFYRLIMYRKVTTSLLEWGEDKFSDKEKKMIKQHGENEYKRLISNNCPSFFKKISFIASHFFRNPKFCILILYLFFNNKKKFKTKR